MSRVAKSMRGACAWLLFLSLLLTAWGARTEEAASPHQVVVQLQWKHQFEFAGFYAAIQQGFYARRGLQVELKEYEQGLDILDEVLSGRAQYGIFHSGVVQARLEGKPVKLLANYFKRNPIVILVRPPIASLADLRGKRLMVAEKDIDAPLFRLAFQKEGLEPGVDVTFVPHAHDAGPFERGEVDAMVAFATNEPFYLERDGIPFNVVELADYLPSLGEEYLFTSEAQLKERPELTQAFVEATNQGWGYALDHPEEIVDLILRDYSQRKESEALLYEARKSAKMVRPLPLPIGELFPNLIEDVAALIRRQRGIEGQDRLTGFLLAPAASAKSGGALLDLTAEERAWIEAHPMIRMAIASGSPPRAFLDKDGLLQGINVDYAREIERRTGLKIELATSEWSTALERALNYEVDAIMNAARMKERESRLSFTDVYIAVPQAVVALEGTAAIKNLDALCGHKVAVVKSTSRAGYLREHLPCIDRMEVDGYVDVITAVVTGKAEFGFENLDMLVRQKQELMLPQIKVVYFDYLSPLGFSRLGVRKDEPLLASILNKAIQSFSEEEKNRLTAKWLGMELPPIKEQGAELGRVELSEAERAWLNDHPRLRYCFSPVWRPYDYFEEGGHRGVFKDYLDLFARKLGVTFAPTPTPDPGEPGRGWFKALDFARERRCDIVSGLVRTPEREAYLDFTEPYFNVTQILIAKPDKPFVGGIEAIQDQVIGVHPGAAISQLLQRDFPAIKIKEVDADGIARALDDGKIYAFVGSLEHMAGWMEERVHDFKIIGKLDRPYPVSVGVRNDWPQLRAILDKAVAAVTQAEHGEIQRRWTTHALEQRIDYGPLRQAGGVAALILGLMLYWNRRMAREIGRRAQVEEQLRKLSRAVEQSGSTIVVTDLQPVIEFVNPAFTRTTGYSAEEAIGQNPRILKSGLQPPEFYQAMWDALARGETWQGELANKRKDGALYWEFATISPVKNDRGETTHFVAVKEEITARKRAEEALRAGEERLRAIIDAEPECIKILDREGRLRQMNPAGLAMVEAERFEQVAGASVFDLIAPEYREAYRAFHDRVIAGEAARMTFEVIGLKGGRRWMETHAVMLEDQGEPAHLAVTRDISAQKAYQAEIVLAKQAAESASLAKSAFIANMSHELRTPLNALLGYAQILRRDDSLSADQRQGAQVIQRSGEHLLMLINDLLDLAKIEAGRFDLVVGPCHLDGVLRSLEGVYRVNANQKNIAFRRVETTPLPAQVTADERRLRQIVMNLLGNAVKFTERGEVRLETSYRDGWLELAVEDTGIGIPPDRISTLFQPFQQAGEVRYRNQGTGLGLAICRHLAEMMGGTIGVRSVPGQGSRFRVRLPLPRLGEAVATGQTEPHPEATGYRRPDGGGSYLAMVVDDISINRRILGKMLNDLGFRVMEAESGEQALELVVRHPPDLVFIDLVMEGIDGLETTRRLLALPGLGGAPVIACTASAFEEDRSRCETAGCSDFLAKPIRRRELLAALERALPIEWIFAESQGEGVSTPPDAAEDADALTPDQRRALLELVQRGEIGVIGRQLDALPEGGNGIVGKLRGAAKAFDMRELRRILEESMES